MDVKLCKCGKPNKSAYPLCIICYDKVINQRKLLIEDRKFMDNFNIKKIGKWMIKL